MRQSVKAALLSGLVFPGLGQWTLKRHGRAAVLIIVSLGCLVVIIKNVLAAASAAAQQILDDGGAVDMAGIHEAAQGAVRSAGGIGTSAAILVLIACWIYGITDACCIGNREK